MIRIVLTDEQTQVISHASEPIDLVDPSGRMLGRMMPATSATAEVPELSPEKLVEIKRRMAAAEEGKGTFSTWKEIKARLQMREEA